MKLGTIACCAALTLAAVQLHLAEAARPAASEAKRFTAETDAWMKAALARLEVVPSVAIAVVVDDDVVLTRGWGTADREARVPATENTLYYIASSTKSFTALAAAILDARHTVDLSSSLADHLDRLKLDPVLVPEKVKLRDLLTHASGVDNEPLTYRLAHTGEHDPETLWRLLEHCTPAENAPLGTHRYSNAGYNILTVLLDRETEKPWQDLLRDEVFKPIGMSHTTAYASLPRAKSWPLAAPYFGLGPSGLERLYLEKQDNTMQSAGGMLTSAADLGRWLQFQLNDGRVDGHQVVDAEIVRRTHQVLVEASEDDPPFGKTGYGLGWAHGRYQDQAILHHSGNFPGFRALVSFAPEARIGVAVLVNEASIGARFADVIAVWAYDWWLGVSPDERRADGRLNELMDQKEMLEGQMAAEYRKFAARRWMLSRPREAYGGTYRNPLYGTLVVTPRDSTFEIRAGNLRCTATAFEKPETARIELVPGEGRVLVFQPPAGDVERVVIGGNAYERVR